MNAPSRSHMTVGAVVAETYKLEALIGRGGMGEVYSASHLRLPGKQVAIKFLHPDVADPEILARFRREAEIATRLGHPNIVTVLDFNNLPDGTPYLVLEYLVGETLDDALARGPFTVERTLAIARQLCSALAAAHRAGVVHRDLKPQNIFLIPTEIEGRVGELAKILDFGISKIRGSTTVKTQDSALLGTPQYMSPEQATGQQDAIDGRTDIFALGAILYEMLSGKAAFAGSSIPEVVFKVVYEPAPPLAEIALGVPPGVIAAIERAMAKKPDERFATVGELITSLTGVGLATLPPPRQPAPGSLADGTGRKVSSADALAKTMGSGDHADALLATGYQTSSDKPATAPNAAPAATMAPPQALPGGAAAPYGPASGAPHGPAYGHAHGHASGMPHGLAGAVPVAPLAANRWKWIAVALAALAAGGVAFAILRRPPAAPPQVVTTAPATTGGSGSASSGAVPIDAAVPSTAPDATIPSPPDAAVPSTPDAGTPPKAPDAGSGDHGKPATKPPVTKPPVIKPPTPPTPPDLGPVVETLSKAWKQAESDPVLAKKLANSVIDSADAPDNAKKQAHQVIALIACLADDRETAVRAARSAGRPLRPKVVKTCADHDIPLRRIR